MKLELQELIDECFNELTDIETRIQNLPHLDQGARYLTHYALIRAAGTAELVYKSIIADHFSLLSSNRIDKYLDSNIRLGSMSATYENMKTLLGKFDDSWSSSFKNAVTADEHGAQMISSASSLVSNRHSFAHGRNTTVSIMQIKQYYHDVVNLINIFDSIVH